MSVSTSPGCRLRRWCSSGSLRIPPLHPEFRIPLLASSPTVSHDPPQLSRGVSRTTHRAACERFTPNKSGQRLPPTYYRGCWHVVSRGLFARYRHYLPVQKGFTTRRPSSPTRRCWVRLSPIAQDS